MSVLETPSCAIPAFVEEDLETEVCRLRKRVEAEPGRADLRIELAQLLSRSGRVKEALVEARRAVELDRSDPEGHVLLAVLLRLNGLVAEAEQEKSIGLHIQHHE
ncbi:MAG: tetratricopeptide repeat protein [Acidobacteria bacterium]|nr:tetratricopeptide repeat protein [Acidobacteriota bacterium]